MTHKTHCFKKKLGITAPFGSNTTWSLISFTNLPVVCCLWPPKWLPFVICQSFCWSSWRMFFSIWPQYVTEDDISRWCSCILSSTWINAIQHTTDNSKADLQFKLFTVCLLLAPFSSFLADCFIFLSWQLLTLNINWIKYSIWFTCKQKPFSWFSNSSRVIKKNCPLQNVELVSTWSGPQAKQEVSIKFTEVKLQKTRIFVHHIACQER